MKEQLNCTGPYRWQTDCSIQDLNVSLTDIFLERIKPAQADAYIKAWKSQKPK